MSSMTGVMISAMRRSMAVLAIRSLLMQSYKHKKTGARPVGITRWSTGSGSQRAAVERGYTPMRLSLQGAQSGENDTDKIPTLCRPRFLIFFRGLGAACQTIH